MKKIVHYSSVQSVQLGLQAMLTPVDHPGNAAHNISNNHPVRTSGVLSYNPKTGAIETRNTIYIPKETK
jgi:hypothetical protein